MRRILAFAAIAFVLFVVAGALSAGRACAHDPRFACSPREEQPVVIDAPQKSWAFYGHLEPGQRDRYVVQTATPVTVPVQLLIDQRDSENPARPVATVADARGKTLATIGLDRSQTFFEPFSRVTYLESPDRSVQFPAGSSTIVVAMHGTASQRYTLAVGSDERFSLLEMPYLLGAVYRIHQRRF